MNTVINVLECLCMSEETFLGYTQLLNYKIQKFKHLINYENTYKMKKKKKFSKFKINYSPVLISKKDQAKKDKNSKLYIF